MNDVPERTNPRPERIFLLSPASLKGVRGRRILEGRGKAPFVERLLSGDGVALGRVHTHISSLYFRGKRAYGRRFGRQEVGPAVLVISPDRATWSPSWPRHGR